jgi:uncharacterized protein
MKNTNYTNVCQSNHSAMEKIIITGGTGFLGLSLARFLNENGFRPILIGRHEIATDFDFVKWDGISLGKWCQALEGAKAIVNLAGRTVDCIKTPDNCDQILRSRVDSTLIIGEALKALANPPKVWVQMSTAHIYGDPPSQICKEDAAFGYGLAPYVGSAWEKAFLKALPRETRGIRLRTSFVIGRNGGALASLGRVVKLGLGGKVGHGNQGMSWLHELDLNRLILESILNEQYEGVYIASSPNPVSNKEFMNTLIRTMRVPFGLSLPIPMIKFGAKYLFKTDPDLAIYGRYVKSERLEKQGFKFHYPELAGALKDLID